MQIVHTIAVASIEELETTGLSPLPVFKLMRGTRKRPRRLANMEFHDSLLVQCISDIESDMKAERKHPMTFHCEKCHTILGDSLSVCGELRWTDVLIMSLKVTHDVVVSETMVTGREGEMANCIYSSLKCRGCSIVVGYAIHSSPLHLADLRSIFLLFKAKISCHILGSCSMVKASTLLFDLKPLSKSISEVRQQCEDHLERMMCLRSMLADESVCSQSPQQ